MEQEYEQVYVDISQDVELPAFKGALKASGFQAPGGEFASNGLDIRSLLPRDQASTYFMEMESNEWQHVHILPKDILVVDASKIELEQHCLVICVLNGEICMRRIEHCNTVPYLVIDKKEKVKVNSEDDFQVFGHVIGIFRSIHGISKFL